VECITEKKVVEYHYYYYYYYYNETLRARGLYAVGCINILVLYYTIRSEYRVGYKFFKIYYHIDLSLYYIIIITYGIIYSHNIKYYEQNENRRYRQPTK